MSDSQSQQTITSVNAYGNDYNSLHLRLNTDSIRLRFELYLKGYRINIATDPNGNLTRVIEVDGIPKANAKGIQYLMNVIDSILNQHVVQGNFPADKDGFSMAYWEYKRKIRLSVNRNLSVNLYHYGIDENEYEAIIDNLMFTVEAFLTRPINNEERKSFGQTYKSVENFGKAAPNKNFPVVNQR